MTLTYPTPEDTLRNIWASVVSFFLSFAKEGEDDEDFLAQADDRTKSTMDTMFGDGDEEEEEDTEEDDDSEEEEDTEEEDTEEDDDDSEEDEDDDDSEEDEDEDDDSEEDEDEDTEDEDTEDEEEEGDRESIAQTQARENGRKAKRYKTERDELQLSLDSATETITDLESRLSESQDTFDPTKSEDLGRLRNDIEADVSRTAARVSSGGETLTNNFSGYIQKYLGSTYEKTPAARSEAMDGLRADIVSDMSGFDEPYDELLDDEKSKADLIIDRVLDLLERNGPKAEEYMDLRTQLEDKSSETRVNLKVKEYSKREDAVLSMLDGIGEVSSDIRKDDPFSVQTTIADMVEADPAAKKKLLKVKKDVVQLLEGPRPLSRKEKTTMEKAGKDLAKFEKQRAKNHSKKQGELLTTLVEYLMVKDQSDEALKTDLSVKAGKAKKNAELDALDRVTRRKKKPVAKKAKSKASRATDRPSAAAGLFGL